MSRDFATAKIKLVTVVAQFSFRDRIANELRELGVSGYTQMKASGWGAHGASEFGLIDSGNIRFEVLASSDMARKILEIVATKLNHTAIVAFASDVEAVPRGHFE